MNTLYLLFYLLAFASFCIGTVLSFLRRPSSLAVGFVSMGLALVALIRVMQLWP